MTRIKKTTLGVVLFVIVALILLAEEAHGHAGDNHHTVSIGVSGGIVHYPSGVTQTLGYTYGGLWTTEYERLGGKGYDKVHAFSVVRQIEGANPAGFGLSLGATYFDGTLEERNRPGKAIVSDTLTYRLGVHYSWRLSSYSNLRLGVLHNSTAGRSERNRGIDRINLSFNWRI